MNYNTMKLNKIAYIQYLFVFLILFSFLLSCNSNENRIQLSDNKIVINKLDRTFVYNGKIKFKAGDNPEYAKADYNDSDWGYQSGTYSWSAYGLKGDKGGWYRIYIDIKDKKASSFGILIPYCVETWELYFNGKLISKSGKIGKNIQDSEPGSNILAVPVYGRSGVLALRLFNIFNTHDRSGILSNIYFGPSDDVVLTSKLYLGNYLLPGGMLLLIFLYHIIFWMYRRKEEVLKDFALLAQNWLVD